LTFRRALLGIFSSAALLLLAYGCASSNDGNTGQFGGGGGGGIGEAGVDESHIGTDGPAQDLDGSLDLNPLCGAATIGCVPDDVNACASYVPPATPNEDSGLLPNEPGSSAQAGAAGAAGEGSGGFSSSLGGDGGYGAGVTGSLAGDGGAPNASGGAAGAAPGSTMKFGCQVQRSDAEDPVIRQCAAVGPGGSNAPCLTSSDCQAGFGCVGDQGTGLCQRYCCVGVNACGPDTYCTERPLRDAVTNAASSDVVSPLMIPVCVPAENCDLNAPYPCPAGTQCACKSGTACLVVRADGTTTCAVPGKGKAGEACPCAWDHVCSAAAQNQCVKLCPTNGASGCDNGGECQSNADLPAGWGVCVASTR
jgi:hypothetical protein